MYTGVPATIRLEEIVWGGVRRDGIPDLRFPPHVSPEEASYLESGDRVFGVSINGDHRAYPLRVLNAHEMANDIVGGGTVRPGILNALRFWNRVFHRDQRRGD